MAAQINDIMDAVVTALNAADIKDANAVTIVARKEIPPNFRDVKTAVFLVFPDGDDLQPNRSQLNEYRPRVNVAVCQEATTEAKRDNLLAVREEVLDMFVGSRLVAPLNEVYCTGEASASAVDLDKLWEDFKWVSVVTFEFDVLRARG